MRITVKEIQYKEYLIIKMSKNSIIKRELSIY